MATAFSVLEIAFVKLTIGRFQSAKTLFNTLSPLTVIRASILTLQVSFSVPQIFKELSYKLVSVGVFLMTFSMLFVLVPSSVV